ncbi:hypothetical protein GCM10029992_63200 [Glycomyces albus]
MSRQYEPPKPHPSGARPPSIPRELLPKHVAITMDGNGRWAKARGLKRTEGHAMGEASLFDTIEGAIELGIGTLSAYAFSTENWRRSPDEVRWLMGFNRDVIHRRRDELNAMGSASAGPAGARSCGRASSTNSWWPRRCRSGTTRSPSSSA